jgi:Domain of unknown function (DUF4268)
VDALYFFYVLFLVFFLAIGGIVFAAWVGQARAAKARAQAATAKKAAARAAAARPSGFAMVTPPSNLGKQVRTPARVNALTERSKHYWDFWEQFLNRVDAQHPGWAKRKTPTRASRCNLPTGTSGVAYSTAFTQHGLSVQLYFSSPDARINLGRFEAFRAIKDEFERTLGQAAEWDDKPGKKAAAICVTSQFDNVADVDLWPVMLDWVLDQHVRLRQAVEAVGGVGILKETAPYMRFAKVG